MKGIILAAGRGNRMKALTDKKPKCLVELNGKPLLEWQLTALRKAGIDEIAIVTGYKKEVLSGYELVEFYNPRWEETNMVSSLDCAREWLAVGPCIVSYSDIFYETSAVKSLMDSSAPLAVTYDPNWRELWEKRFGDPLIDAETFRLNTDGTLAEIGNKPDSVEDVEGQYMGLLRFTPQGWASAVKLRSALESKENDSMHMTGMLNGIIQKGILPITAIRNIGPWGEIDNQADLNLYLSQ